MNNPRTALAFVTLFAFVALVSLTLVGCGGPTPANDVPPSAQLSAPSARYAPRTDLLVIAIPEGAPTHWPAAGFPPPRSARLFPNTPDRDLAAELRKQLAKNVLDP